MQIAPVYWTQVGVSEEREEKRTLGLVLLRKSNGVSVERERERLWEGAEPRERERSFSSRRRATRAFSQAERWWCRCRWTGRRRPRTT